MMRCGQMIYFEALLELYLRRGRVTNWVSLLQKMLYLFNDNLTGEVAPYSIQNIVPEAHEAFNIKPGEWFRSTSILMAIERLNKKFQPRIAKNLEMITFVESIIYVNVLHDRLVKPFKELNQWKDVSREEGDGILGAENGNEVDPISEQNKQMDEAGGGGADQDKPSHLANSPYRSETISPTKKSRKTQNFEKLKQTEKNPIEKKQSQKSEYFNGLGRFIIPENLPDGSDQGYIRPNLGTINQGNDPPKLSKSEQNMERMLEELYTTPWKKDVLISIATRIGVNEPEDRFQAFLKEMLSMRQCLGILGGQNNRAYYIIGYHGSKNKFYYLDPHYIQVAVDPKKLGLETYLKKTVHEYNYKDMNSSMQISFLVSGNKEFELLMRRLRSTIKFYGSEKSFISVLETNDFHFDSGELVEF